MLAILRLFIPPHARQGIALAVVAHYGGFMVPAQLQSARGLSWERQALLSVVLMRQTDIFAKARMEAVLHKPSAALQCASAPLAAEVEGSGLPMTHFIMKRVKGRLDPYFIFL